MVIPHFEYKTNSIVWKENTHEYFKAQWGPPGLQWVPETRVVICYK